jgi:hypothetical protein
LQGGGRLAFLQRDSASSLTPGPAGSTPPPPSEAERLAAAKSTKELLAKGISLFNTKGPLKGIESLIANNLLESSPAAVRGGSCLLCAVCLFRMLHHRERRRVCR